MFQTKTIKENSLHRLKIIQGNINNIIHMINADAYCIDVLTQTKAVKNALQKVEEQILEQHLSHCVVDHVKKGNSDKAIAEVMKIFRSK